MVASTDLYIIFYYSTHSHDCPGLRTALNVIIYSVWSRTDLLHPKSGNCVRGIGEKESFRNINGYGKGCEICQPLFGSWNGVKQQQQQQWEFFARIKKNKYICKICSVRWLKFVMHCWLVSWLMLLLTVAKPWKTGWNSAINRTVRKKS